MNWVLLYQCAGLVLGLMSALWLISVFRRDASIVDPWWSILFLVITLYVITSTGWTPGKTLLAGIVGAWAIRLWIHLLLRSLGESEDPRYVAFRQQFGPERYWWVSFFQVFMLQGALAVLISFPLQVAGGTTTPDPITWFDILGTLVFFVGFGVEVVADWQLNRFRNNTANHGKVLDTGLWRYSRHPNYFGESVLWWGFWICTLDTPWGWATVLAPALMTFLLLKVSGVVMLDKQLLNTKPAYRAYQERTSAFIPKRPKDQ